MGHEHPMMKLAFWKEDSARGFFLAEAACPLSWAVERGIGVLSDVAAAYSSGELRQWMPFSSTTGGRLVWSKLADAGLVGQILRCKDQPTPLRAITSEDRGRGLSPITFCKSVSNGFRSRADPSSTFPGQAIGAMIHDPT